MKYFEYLDGQIVEKEADDATENKLLSIVSAWQIVEEHHESL